MNLPLIPWPKKIAQKKGKYTIPASGIIAYDNPSLEHVALSARRIFQNHNVKRGAPGKAALAISIARRLPEQGYLLTVSAKGVRITARDAEGAVNAMRTLQQLCGFSPSPSIPCVNIQDAPDMPNRGIYYDISRGRVPQMDQLIKQIDLLASCKINQFQLYFEHTFLFPANPDISRNASPLTSRDIMDLDRHCREVGVELVPSLASFGHMSRILTLPKYRHMAEDFGVGNWTDPASQKMPAWQKHIGWTISPANPDTYNFLESLFSQFLPLFSSHQFNICCDETFDLGLGQTADLRRQKGLPQVYLDHILALVKISNRYDKRVMVWGDMLLHYPEVLDGIPRDVTVLDWKYSHNQDFSTQKLLRKAKLQTYTCPGTSSWVSLFPRLHEASANIRNAASAAVKYEATGMLTTDWGDGGHYNFMEYSWPGFLLGAEMAWNASAPADTFLNRFTQLIFNVDDPKLTRAISDLGDVTHLSVDGFYQSVWLHIFFANADSRIFTERKRNAWISENGKIKSTTIDLGPALARKTISTLESIRSVFLPYHLSPERDPHGLIPYWIFAVDTLLLSARKLEIVTAEHPDAQKVAQLARDMEMLMKRFRELWLARNRLSEIDITLNRYRDAMGELLRFSRFLTAMDSMPKTKVPGSKGRTPPPPRQVRHPRRK